MYSNYRLIGGANTFVPTILAVAVLLLERLILHNFTTKVMMMNKKLTLIGLILSLTMSLSAFAAEEYHHGGDSSARVEHLTKVLDLTADQQVKVKAIFDKQQEDMKAIHEAAKTSLQAVLTKEQSAKLDAAHEEHKKMGKAAKQ